MQKSNIFFLKWTKLRLTHRTESRARLDVFLRVGEEGPSIESFNANPVIDLWFNDRVRILNAGPLNYKRKKNNEGAGAVDLDSLTMSDLENREEFDFFTFP